MKGIKNVLARYAAAFLGLILGEVLYVILEFLFGGKSLNVAGTLNEAVEGVLLDSILLIPVATLVFIGLIYIGSRVNNEILRKKIIFCLASASFILTWILKEFLEASFSIVGMITSFVLVIGGYLAYKKLILK